MREAVVSGALPGSELGILARIEAGAAAVVGAFAVALFAGLQGFVRWVTGSYGWVPFFLLTKPLVDLSWRWEFVEIVNQRVNPQAILAAFVTALSGIVVIWEHRKPQHFRHVLLLLGVAALSVALTPTSWGINELIRLLSGVCFFFSAGLVLSEEKKFDRFSKVFLAILCVPLFLSILQVVGILPFEYWDWLENQDVGRASGTYQHPLEIVFFLVYAIPISLYLWEKSGKGAIERVFLGVFSVLAFLGLVFTYHRGGWITISMELGIWFAWKKQVKRTLLGALALVILASLFSDWFTVLSQPVTQILHGEADFSSGEFLRGRGVNWFVFLTSYVNGGPVGWIVGKGGSVADPWVGRSLDFAENEPHNDFIRLLHAYGLAGLILYSSLLLSFFRAGWRLRSSNIPFRNSMGRILVCSLSGIILLSLTTEPMRYPTAIWYLFAFASIVMFSEQRHGGRLNDGSH